MRARVVRAMLIVGCLPAMAGAQSVTITESEALARLSADSPRVRAIRSSVDLARADVLSAARWPNPRVNVDRESVAGVSETLTTVLQPLPVTGRRRLEREAASAAADAHAGRAEDEARRPRADLRLAYARLAAAPVRERELSRSRAQPGD